MVPERRPEAPREARWPRTGALVACVLPLETMFMTVFPFVASRSAAADVEVRRNPAIGGVTGRPPTE